MSQLLNDSFNESTSIHPELLRKWRQIFYFVTSHSNGISTVENWERVSRRFMTNVNIPAEKGEKIANLFQQAWKRLFGEKMSVTLEEFIADKTQLHLFHAGTEALTNVYFYSKMFPHIDFNDDGEIDFSEFLIFSKACGFKDEATIKKAFIAIDVDKNGVISKEEYIEAHVKYDVDAAVTMEDMPIYGLP